MSIVAAVGGGTAAWSQRPVAPGAADPERTVFVDARAGATLGLAMSMASPEPRGD
jgi:hypothetical protein